MSTLTSATEKKRRDLMFAVERLLAPEPCVQGLDCKLCDLAQWRSDDSVWTEGQRAALAGAWIGFDRDGSVTQLITERTAYDDATRIVKLDSAVCTLEGLLLHGAPHRVWETLGPLVAFDRLNAAYDALMQALFALNRRWRNWREREMSHILRLPWLPSEFERRALTAINAPSQAYEGYHVRATLLEELFDDVVAELQREGFYGGDPIGEAFVRSHNEPGRAWNMAEWTVKQQARSHSR